MKPDALDQAQYDLNRSKPGDGQASLRTPLPVTGIPALDKPRYIPHPTPSTTQN